MKILMISILLLCVMGCAMTIKATEGGCTLDGFGAGKGKIEGKCEVEKGLITFPQIKVNN